MSVQGDSSMLLANTTNASGTITLPSATAKPGRVITCKDIGGNAGVSSIILSTISGQMFEDGLSIRTINQAYGFESFIATSGGKWLTVAGNELYDIGASTATLQKTLASSIVSYNIVTSSMNVLQTLSTYQIDIYGPSTLRAHGPSYFLGDMYNTTQISTPSLLASSINAQEYLYKSQPQPFLQNGTSTFQTLQNAIVLPVHYADKNYTVHITPHDAVKTDLPPHASSISVSSFYAHGEVGKGFYWMTAGNI
jgi:hypothetical protein